MALFSELKGEGVWLPKYYHLITFKGVFFLSAGQGMLYKILATEDLQLLQLTWP